MTPDSTKPTTQVFALEIQAPIEKVWEEVTAMNLPRRFYMDTVLVGRAEPGARLAYRSADGRFTFLVGRVLEVVPNTRFVHTFRFPRVDEGDTRVTYLLEATAGGTRLTVRHEGLENAPKTGGMIVRGWPMILGNLKSLIETGRLPLSTRFKYLLMKALFPILPGKARLRTEAVEREAATQDARTG